MTVLSRAEVEALRKPKPRGTLDKSQPTSILYTEKLEMLIDSHLSLFDRVAEERAAREAAEAQVARLRIALEPFAKSHDKVPRYEHVVAARAALAPQPPDK